MITGTCAGISGDDNNTAGHPVFITAACCANKITCVTVNFDLATFHFTAGINKCVSGNFYISACHKLAQIGTGIALNSDASMSHRMTDMIQFGRTVLKADIIDIIAADIKQLINR